MSYTLRWRPSAERDIQDLPSQARRRVMVRIDALAENPLPAASSALSGQFAGMRRLRVGDYRVAYLVDESSGFVGIVAVGHRSRFYEDLRRTGSSDS